MQASIKGSRFFKSCSSTEVDAQTCHPTVRSFWVDSRADVWIRKCNLVKACEWHGWFVILVCEVVALGVAWPVEGCWWEKYAKEIPVTSRSNLGQWEVILREAARLFFPFGWVDASTIQGEAVRQLAAHLKEVPFKSFQAHQWADPAPAPILKANLQAKPSESDLKSAQTQTHVSDCW